MNSLILFYFYIYIPGPFIDTDIVLFINIIIFVATGTNLLVHIAIFYHDETMTDFYSPCGKLGKRLCTHIRVEFSPR